MKRACASLLLAGLPLVACTHRPAPFDVVNPTVVQVPEYVKQASPESIYTSIRYYVDFSKAEPGFNICSPSLISKLEGQHTSYVVTMQIFNQYGRLATLPLLNITRNDNSDGNSVIPGCSTLLNPSGEFLVAPTVSSAAPPGYLVSVRTTNDANGLSTTLGFVGGVTKLVGSATAQPEVAAAGLLISQGLVLISQRLESITREENSVSPLRLWGGNFDFSAIKDGKTKYEIPLQIDRSTLTGMTRHLAGVLIIEAQSLPSRFRSANSSGYASFRTRPLDLSSEQIWTTGGVKSLIEALDATSPTAETKISYLQGQVKQAKNITNIQSLCRSLERATQQLALARQDRIAVKHAILRDADVLVSSRRADAVSRCFSGADAAGRDSDQAVSKLMELFPTLDGA